MYSELVKSLISPTFEIMEDGGGFIVIDPPNKNIEIAEVLAIEDLSSSINNHGNNMAKSLDKIAEEKKKQKETEDINAIKDRISKNIQVLIELGKLEEFKQSKNYKDNIIPEVDIDCINVLIHACYDHPSEVYDERLEYILRNKALIQLMHPIQILCSIIMKEGMKKFYLWDEFNSIRKTFYYAGHFRFSNCDPIISIAKDLECLTENNQKEIRKKIIDNLYKYEIDEYSMLRSKQDFVDLKNDWISFLETLKNKVYLENLLRLDNQIIKFIFDY